MEWVVLAFYRSYMIPFSLLQLGARRGGRGGKGSLSRRDIAGEHYLSEVFAGNLMEGKGTS